MTINTKQIISVTEANQNFSRATRIADEAGSAIIFKSNMPKYKLVNLELEPDLALTDDEKIDIVAKRIMQRFKPAFLELADAGRAVASGEMSYEDLLKWVREHVIL